MAGEPKPAKGPIQITSDAVNCLVYAYLQDSGLEHAAFAIRKEAHLERSSLFQCRIPRGELVDLLYKALAYIEVECHFRNNDEASQRCVAPFSLLEPHDCSTTLKTPSAIPASVPAVTSTPVSHSQQSSHAARGTSTITPMEDVRVDKVASSKPKDHGTKRKADNTLSESAVEKRVRTETPGALEPRPQPSTSSFVRAASSSPTIRYLPGHTAETFYVAFNPKEPNLLASGSRDAAVNVWNLDLLEDGPIQSNSPAVKKITYFSKDTARDLTCLVWDNSGKLLSVGSIDHYLRVIKWEDTSMYMSSKDHTAAVFAVKFSPSGRSILTASLDGTVTLWDTATQKKTRKYRSHTKAILDVIWLSETMFASCSQDTRICVHLADRAQIIKVFQGHRSEVTRLQMNESRTKLASGSEDKTLKIWNIQSLGEDELPGFTPQPVTLTGHTATISTMTWSPVLRDDGHETLVSVSFDKTCRVWDTDTGSCLRLFEHAAITKPLYAVGICPDGRWVATGSGDCHLFIHDLKTLKTVWWQRLSAPKSAIFDIDWQYLDNGETNRFAMALENGKIGIVDVKSFLGALEP